MKKTEIKSFAKINLSLLVTGKLNTKLHKILSVVSFINVYDKIYIKEQKIKSHKVVFSGKFSKAIPNINTITNLLKILDSKKKLNNKKYLIKVIKNTPQQAGLGGGSMNASAILSFFLKNKLIKIKKKELEFLAKKIGSDVIIGIKKSPSVIINTSTIKELKQKFYFHILIVKPTFGCSSKEIYKRLKNFSRPNFNPNKIKKFTNEKILNSFNDLERPAFKKYPKLKKMKLYMNKLDKVIFVRMSGSGSSLVSYFYSKNAALKAHKLLKKKYKNYWCILSKTI